MYAFGFASSLETNNKQHLQSRILLHTSIKMQLLPLVGHLVTRTKIQFTLTFLWLLFFATYSHVSLGNHAHYENKNQPKKAADATKLPVTSLDLLLNVPFYVYEELLWLENVTLQQKSQQVLDTFDDMVRVSFKHSTDYHFARAAMKHPMRTRNPSEARLFVVPAMLNRVVDQQYWKGKFCYHDHDDNDDDHNTTARCNNDLVKYTEKVLAESPWYQRNGGRDHLVVRSHWDDFHYETPMLFNCNVITFESRKRNAADRLSFSDLYVGRACESKGDKLHDFCMVASMHWDRPTFQSRRNICKWTRNNTQAGRSYDFSLCGRGKQCPALARSRFGFHVRGDSFGSNRLMDTILSETVPIFTAKEQYDILPPWIDWSQLSHFVNIRGANITNKFLRQLDDLVADQAGYQHKHEHLVANRELFDWTTLVPFDTYMFMLSSKLWPDEIRSSYTSKYSALILPERSEAARSD